MYIVNNMWAYTFCGVPITLADMENNMWAHGGIMKARQHVGTLCCELHFESYISHGLM